MGKLIPGFSSEFSPTTRCEKISKEISQNMEVGRKHGLRILVQSTAKERRRYENVGIGVATYTYSLKMKRNGNRRKFTDDPLDQDDRDEKLLYFKNCQKKSLNIILLFVCMSPNCDFSS